MSRILILSLLLTFTTLSSVAQPDVTIGDTTIVNDDETKGFARPRIVLVDDSIPLVIWGKATNKGIYSSKWNGTSFDDPIEVSPSGLNTFVANWAGPEVAASGNSVFVTFKAVPEKTSPVYIVRSNDGGASWGDTIRVTDERWSRFPTVTATSGGDPIVAFMEFDSNFVDPRYVVCRSWDGGDTFDPPSAASELTTGESCDCCPATLLENNNDVTLLWRANQGDIRDIWAALSTDGGDSFTVAKNVDQNNWNISVCPSTGADALQNEDSFLHVWMSGASDDSRVYVASVNSSDLTLGRTAMMTPNASMNINQNYPKIAGFKNHLGVVYEESEIGKGQVILSYSTIGVEGLISGESIRLNMDTLGLKLNPDIAWHAGSFHTVWQDNRNKRVMYRKIGLSSATTIQEDEMNEITLQPNPASGMVQIAHSIIGTVAIEIHDPLGRQILHQSDFTSNQVNTQNWSPGVYMISLLDKNGERHQVRLLRQ